MTDKAVWVLAPTDSDWTRCLASSHCRMERFPESAALHKRLIQGEQPPDALVLLADVASNCRIAQSTRAVWSDLILVAWHGQPVGPEQAALLACGVDYVLRPGDPHTLLVSVLLALDYRRTRFGPDVQPRPFAPLHQTGADLIIGLWRLMDQGWRLGYEGAGTLHLTVSERALLLYLFEAPGHVASHADLIAAVLQVWQPRQRARIRDPRCRSIISRLRLRACDAGMPTPPVESLRDFGYAWAL